MATDSPFRAGRYDAVVFDIGGVFLYPAIGPLGPALDEIGMNLDDEQFRRAHHAGCAALSAAVAASSAATTNVGVDEANPDFWASYNAAYLASLGLDAATAAELSPLVRTSWDWAHQANIDAFHRIAALRPVAIVSNNDGSAEPSMAEFGVCQVGPGPLPEALAIVDSAVIGIAKPDPAIMTPALEAIGIAPARVLYVGDTVHADVVGAGNAGMGVVQLDPFDHHGEYDHDRIDDLSALADAFENASGGTATGG